MNELTVDSFFKLLFSSWLQAVREEGIFDLTSVEEKLNRAGAVSTGGGSENCLIRVSKQFAALVSGEGTNQLIN